MRKHHTDIKTLFQNPLHHRDFHLLPQCKDEEEIVLCGDSLREFFQVTEILRKLAPNQGNDGRTVWIEVVRGRLSEWGMHKELASEGIILDRAEYARLWKMAIPWSVSWWRIDYFSSKDKLSVRLTDGHQFCTVFTNRWAPSDADGKGPIKPISSRMITRTLKHLNRYLDILVKSAEIYPDLYNRYLASHMAGRFLSTWGLESFIKELGGSPNRVCRWMPIKGIRSMLELTLGDELHESIDGSFDSEEDTLALGPTREDVGAPAGGGLLSLCYRKFPGLGMPQHSDL